VKVFAFPLRTSRWRTGTLASASVTQTEFEVRKAPRLQDASPAVADRADRVFVIRPAPRWPHLDLGELWHYRELLFRLVWRDIVVRYKQTFLGVAWALLVPIFTSGVYVVVFGKFAQFPAGELPYEVLVFSGVLPMQYFTSALTGSSTSLVANANLVTKVYFPRVLLPLAGVLVPAVDFLLALGLLVGLMAWFGTWPTGPEVALAPVFLGLAFIAALGIGFLLGALNVRYRDVPYAIPVFLSALPLVSAVPYEFNEIPERWQWILSLNPMPTVISGWRWAVLGAPAPHPGQAAVGAAVAVTLLLGGLAFFRSSEPRFADTM
jgi:lipopolysaccharide transport system permease protein